MPDPELVYESEVYALQCYSFIKKCKLKGCPARPIFETIIILYEETQRLKEQLKYEREFPNES